MRKQNASSDKLLDMAFNLLILSLFILFHPREEEMKCSRKETPTLYYTFQREMRKHLINTISKEVQLNTLADNKILKIGFETQNNFGMRREEEGRWSLVRCGSPRLPGSCRDPWGQASRWGLVPNPECQHVVWLSTGTEREEREIESKYILMEIYWP